MFPTPSSSTAPSMGSRGPAAAALSPTPIAHQLDQAESFSRPVLLRRASSDPDMKNKEQSRVDRQPHHPQRHQPSPHLLGAPHQPRNHGSGFITPERSPEPSEAPIFASTPPRTLRRSRVPHQSSSSSRPGTPVRADSPSQFESPRAGSPLRGLPPRLSSRPSRLSLHQSQSQSQQQHKAKAVTDRSSSSSPEQELQSCVSVDMADASGSRSSMKAEVSGQEGASLVVEGSGELQVEYKVEQVPGSDRKRWVLSFKQPQPQSAPPSSGSGSPSPGPFGRMPHSSPARLPAHHPSRNMPSRVVSQPSTPRQQQQRPGTPSHRHSAKALSASDSSSGSSFSSSTSGGTADASQQTYDAAADSDESSVASSPAPATPKPHALRAHSSKKSEFPLRPISPDLQQRSNKQRRPGHQRFNSTETVVMDGCNGEGEEEEPYYGDDVLGLFFLAPPFHDEDHKKEEEAEQKTLAERRRGKASAQLRLWSFDHDESTSEGDNKKEEGEVSRWSETEESDSDVN